MSNLIDHAKRELELVGQYEEDPAFAVSVLAAVSAFAAYPGHSGGSAFAGISMISDLLQFKNLSPLTNDPAEWVHHGPDTWGQPGGIWQNVRNGSAFSEDGGLTYTLVDEDKRAEPYRTRITHDNSGQLLSKARMLPVENHDDSMNAAMPYEGDTQDAIVGIRCACGKIIREDEFVAHCNANSPGKHFEKRGE